MLFFLMRERAMLKNGCVSESESPFYRAKI